MMKKIDELASIMRMIEDGDLITESQVQLRYGLTPEQVEEAVRDGDLEKVRFTRKDYFFDRQVEMLKEAMQEG